MSLIFCTNCGWEISNEPQRTPYMVGNKPVCAVCYEMYCAVYMSEWMKKCHSDYLDELRRKKRLRPGGNYFSD